MYPIHSKPNGKRTNSNCTASSSSKSVSLPTCFITHNNKRYTTTTSLSKTIMSVSWSKSKRGNALENYGRAGGIVCQCSPICSRRLSVG